MSPEGSTLLFEKTPSGLDRKTLRQFLRTLTATVAGERPFTCLITNDASLQRLNVSFLGHDYATDVLSFPSIDGARELGEIAISHQRAAEQAASFGHSIETEIEILMLHGVLHLLGHDHETDRGAMRRLEKKWRVQLSLPASLIERTRK
ncbi:MAG: rRNA maturation RNase YbeY [Acidobacteria bacterium]|nr:rRNA maturation RNase YbeY [Acidobacteriota bacterium]